MVFNVESALFSSVLSHEILSEFKAEESDNGRCVWCGLCPGVYLAKKVFSEGFTNLDRCRNQAGSHICADCVVMLKTPELRKSSWIVSPGGIRYLKRDEVAEALFGAKTAPFCFYVTTSFKKLGQTKVRLNYDVSNFLVVFEEIPVFVRPSEDIPLFNAIREMYSVPKGEEDKAQLKSFFTKDEMRTGDYQYQRIKEYGIAEWRAKEDILKNYRGTPLLEMFLFIVNQEKLGIAKRFMKEEKARPAKSKGKKDGEKKQCPADAGQARASVSDCVPRMACNRLGQYLLFETDEDI